MNDLKHATDLYLIRNGNDYFETLYDLVNEGLIELSVNEKLFGHDEITDYACAYARAYKEGSVEDFELNFGDGLLRKKYVEAICEETILAEIEGSENE